MENNKEYEKWLETVSDDGLELENVPADLRTYEMCFEAINDHSGALEFVPEEHKTKELCETVLRYDGFALEFVPEELKTFEFCDMVVDSFIIKESEYADIVSKMILSGSHAIIPENLQNKIAKMIETTVPVEFQEEIAKKHDIELPKKTNERGR